jgi:hypothetical protein
MSDEDNLVIDQNDEEKKEVDENLKMIKIDDVDESLRKNLNFETIFKFQCENVDNKLRLGLKEINKFSPYYYERFFTKEELDEINKIRHTQQLVNSRKIDDIEMEIEIDI